MFLVCVSMLFSFGVVEVLVSMWMLKCLLCLCVVVMCVVSVCGICLG